MLVCFCLLIALIGIIAGVEKNLISEAKNSTYIEKAKKESEKCALIIDSFYSNNGGLLKNVKIECYTKPKPNVIASTHHNIERQSYIINSSSSISSGGKINVEIDEHYR